MLRRAPVRATLLIVAVEGFAMFMSFTYVAALVQSRHPIGLAAVGLLVALFGGGGVAFVLLARPLTTLVTNVGRAGLGAGLIAAGFIILAVDASLAASGVALAILGFGFLMLHNVLQVRATNMAPDAPGVGLSLFAAAFFLSQGLGSAIGGLIFDHVGHAVPFGISALLFAVLGVALGIWRLGEDAWPYEAAKHRETEQQIETDLL